MQENINLHKEQDLAELVTMVNVKQMITRTKIIKHLLQRKVITTFHNEGEVV